MLFHVRVHLIDEAQNLMFHATEWQEVYAETEGHLFRSYRKEYGRCQSRMYIDTKEKEAKPIGWVFQKRVSYEVTPKRKFLQSAWVEIKEVKA